MDKAVVDEPMDRWKLTKSMTAINADCHIGEVAFLEERTGNKRLCAVSADCPIGYYCNRQSGTCCGEPGECPNGFRIATNFEGYILTCSLSERNECPLNSSCHPSTTVSQHLCCVKEQQYRCPGNATPYPNGYHPLKCSLNSSINPCPSLTRCLPSGTDNDGICCTVRRHQQMRNGCPAGWIYFGKTIKYCNPATQTSCSGMSSCLPSVYAPQQFICCIPVSITNNNIFGSASSVSLTCSNSQLNPEIMANGQARPCSLINPICSPGYVCQPSAQTSQMICCTAATSAAYSCPLPTQAPALSGTSNVFCSSLGTNSACPSGATCQLAAQQTAIFICCYGAAVIIPQCPSGTTNQQGPLGYVVCDITSTVQQCQTGYLCTRAANDNSRAICCAGQTNTVAACPNQQTLFTSNGSPRYCSPNILSLCPDGYVCTAAVNLPGTYICCSGSTSNGCPVNFTPSLSSTGSEIFCTPTDPNSCPSGSVCLESQLAAGSGQYLCCRSSQAPRVCPNNQNALVGDDGQVVRCTGPGAPCSEVNFTCQYSSTLGNWVCCGQGQSRILCADGRDTYYQVEGQTYLCMPFSVPTGCPINYDCSPSTVPSTYVCCRQQLLTSTVPSVTVNPSCPTGWNPYRNELDGSNRYCQNAIDMNCPTGFSCTQSTQQGLYLCCRLATSLRCASGQATLLVNGQPRLCHNLRRNACPSGYSCRLSNIVNVYICCANFHLLHSDSTVSEGVRCLNDALFSTDEINKVQYCESSVDCPFGYICSLSTQFNAAICCKKKTSSSKFPAVKSESHICDEMGVSLETDKKLLEYFDDNNNCPTEYNCRIRSYDDRIYCCKNSMCTSDILPESFESCIAANSNCNPIYRNTKYDVSENYGRCLDRETLLLSNSPVHCNTEHVCPTGYICSNRTTNTQRICCKQYNLITSVCPENREPYRQDEDGSLMFCKGEESYCPDDFVCKQSMITSDYICCSPIITCPDNSVALIDPATTLPKRCFSDYDTESHQCPSDYKCTVSAVKYISVCCKISIHISDFTYDKAVPQGGNSAWYILEDNEE
uniref:CC domain-containing protein n=1 Tax=Syphacia muris TaxID=451379 RepID=A0A158R573_9BILA